MFWGAEGYAYRENKTDWAKHMPQFRKELADILTGEQKGRFDYEITGHLGDVPYLSIGTKENRYATDGRMIRPTDEPITSAIDFDWCQILSESLFRSVELRRQKWQIKSLELQLKAARSLTRPQLDLVSQYRRNGLGRQGDEALSADEMARTLDTINYEITCGFGPRVPRRHLREDEE